MSCDMGELCAELTHLQAHHIWNTNRRLQRLSSCPPASWDHNFKVVDRRRWSDTELVTILQVEARRLGRRPRRADFGAATVDRPPYRKFAVRFDSWTDAVERQKLIRSQATRSQT
jgi:Homing endonuclease associated repeat